MTGKDVERYTFDRILRIAIAAATVYGIVWLLGRLADVLIPFAAAVLLAYLINPLVELIQRRIRSRSLCVFLALGVVAGIMTFLVWLIFPMVGREISHMGGIAKDLVSNSDLAARAKAKLPPDIWDAIKDQLGRSEIQEFFKKDSVWRLASSAGHKLVPGVWGVITGTASLLMGVVGSAVVLLYLVFLLLDYEKLASWHEMVPPAYRKNAVALVDAFNAAMHRHFRGQATVAFIVGILFATGFSLVGLPMGILLGLIIGLLNMVPYLQILGLPPAIVLAVLHALETNGRVGVAVGLTCLVFAVVQTIQDGFLVPRIMGKTSGLRPAMILLSLSVWGKLFGLFGLLIGLPMTCLILAYYQRYLGVAGPPAPVSPVFDLTDESNEST